MIHPSGESPGVDAFKPANGGLRRRARSPGYSLETAQLHNSSRYVVAWVGEGL